MNPPEITRKIEIVYDDAITLFERCQKYLLTIREAMLQMSELDNAVRTILPPQSDIWRIYDRRIKERIGIWGRTKSGYVNDTHCEIVKRRIQIIEEVLNSIDPSFLRDNKQRRQYFFEPGQEYRALSTVFNLMKRATSRLIIVDNYLDEVVFDYILSLDNKLDVQLPYREQETNISTIIRISKENSSQC